MQRNHYLPATNYLQNVMSAIWQVDGFLNQQETIIPKGFIRGYSIIIQAEAWRFSIIFHVDEVFKIKHS